MKLQIGYLGSFPLSNVLCFSTFFFVFCFSPSFLPIALNECFTPPNFCPVETFTFGLTPFPSAVIPLFNCSLTSLDFPDGWKKGLESVAKARWWLRSSRNIFVAPKSALSFYWQPEIFSLVSSDFCLEIMKTVALLCAKFQRETSFTGVK